MNYIKTLLLTVLLLVQVCLAAIYTNTWAAHIEGGEDVARSLIEEHGFIYLGKVMPDIYHLQHRRVVKRSAFASPEHHITLADHPKVQWIEQQVAKTRVKRDLFNDPKWARMWYLNRAGGLDMNVQEAWKMDITGKDIVVTILDDGIEKDHPDLKTNYDPQASHDVNGRDPDPQPRYDYTNENKHGTRCAGEVAAEADNDICSVGVAYKAKIGGVRMLDGDVTDAVEAQSLSHNPQHVDIYSASWGPDDDGRTVDGPATLARKAFHDGITKGRQGLGSIFVWASGNGGNNQDSCNCDGYTNSIYTLSISSATESGKIPWYSEQCSSTLATTYSSGSGGERQIVTTDLRKSCTEAHTGTSASAPLAAGITALALHANPKLTWRDMQHIVVMTARTANLRADDWKINGVGRNVSHSFGYGLMDAGAMVKLAKNWTNVPKPHKCQIYSADAQRGIPVNDGITVKLQSDGCRGTSNEVFFLEHVQAMITISASRRGELSVFLRSPMGTKSTLLTKRSRDTSTEGFNNWAFMTTHSWGEFATGTWSLEVVNGQSTATLLSWSLVLYGTDKPTHSSKPSRPNIENPHQGCSQEDAPYYMNGACFSQCPQGFYVANKTITVPSRYIPNLNESSFTNMNALTLEQIIAVSTMAELNRNAVADDYDGEDNSTVEIVYQECLQCWSKCANCSGPQFEECHSCFYGYNMSKDTCLKVFSNSYMSDHFILTITVFACIGAVLVFVIVFSLLQFQSTCKDGKGRQGYRMADIEDTSANNNFSTRNGNGHFSKSNGVSKSELERQKLLEDSESDIDNEVFAYDKQNPENEI